MSAEINTEQLLVLVKELRDQEQGRAKWFVGPLVTIIIAAFGVFASWGMMMKTTEYLQAQVETLSTKVANSDFEITQLKINQRGNDIILGQIKDDVKEVKDNVKELIRRKGGDRGYK